MTFGHFPLEYFSGYSPSQIIFLSFYMVYGTFSPFHHHNLQYKAIYR